MLGSSLSPTPLRTPAPTAGRGSMRVHPDFHERLKGLGLDTPEALLQFRGEIVSGHVRRHVQEVRAGDFHGFLKKEHSVRWSERLHNAWEGFGFSSKSRRERMLLEQLRLRQFDAPRWVAEGSVAGRAFLLIEAFTGRVELHQFLERLSRSARQTLASRIGAGVAELHTRQIDHPDLYAKHLLICPESWRIGVIDWQRSRGYRRIPDAARAATLAGLLATLPEPLRPPLMQSYLAAWPDPQGRLRRMVEHQIVQLQARLARRRQRSPLHSHHAQRLVWLDGEGCCVIPEMVDAFTAEGLLHWVYQPSRGGVQRRQLAGGRRVRLEASRTAWSWGRLRTRLAGKVWRAPQMIRARDAFAAQAAGEPGERLLAFGQREHGVAGGSAFVLFEELA